MGRVHQGNLALKQRPHSGKRLPLRRRSYGRVLYNRFRYFDPATGRYINADALGQLHGTNVFDYARMNPLEYLDPDGREPAPHRKRRGSKAKTNNKHTKKRSGGSEKADARRRPPRNPPKNPPSGWKGKWPPSKWPPARWPISPIFNIPMVIPQPGSPFWCGMFPYDPACNKSPNSCEL